MLDVGAWSFRASGPLPLDGQRLEILQIHKFQCGNVAGFENDLRGATGPQCLGPTLHAKTPAVAVLQAGKIVFGARRTQVVAARAGKLKEFGGHLDAHGVLSVIAGTGPAVPIAIKSGERLMAATFQFSA